MFIELKFPDEKTKTIVNINKIVRFEPYEVKKCYIVMDKESIIVEDSYLDVMAKISNQFPMTLTKETISAFWEIQHQTIQ